MTPEEELSRMYEPKLWAMVDANADDDDWNGATAANARRALLRDARIMLDLS